MELSFWEGAQTWGFLVNHIPLVSVSPSPQFVPALLLNPMFCTFLCTHPGMFRIHGLSVKRGNFPFVQHFDLGEVEGKGNISSNKYVSKCTGASLLFLAP